MELFLFGLGVCWIACAVLTYGIAFADFQARFPESADRHRRDDMGFAALNAIAGPIGFLITLCATGFAQHGVRYRGSPRADRPRSCATLLEEQERLTAQTLRIRQAALAGGPERPGVATEALVWELQKRLTARLYRWDLDGSIHLVECERCAQPEPLPEQRGVTPGQAMSRDGMPP